MKATDLPLLSSVSRPTVHPDGSRAVIAVSRPDLAADRYVGQLWSVPFDGGAPRRASRGLNDSSPRFSPDGAQLAFLRVVGDAPAQVFVMDAAGGEPVQVTDQPLGVAGYQWSPDSACLAFVSRVPEAGRYGTVKLLGPSAEPARRITTLKFRSNGVGYTIDRRSQVFLVPVPAPAGEPDYPAAPSVAQPSPEAPAAAPKARQLTSGDFEHGAIAFSPDGSRLAVVSAWHANRDLDLVSEIFAIALDTDAPGDPVRISPEGANLDVRSLAFAADGSLYFLAGELGESGRDFIGRPVSLYLLDPSGTARRLTDETLDLGEAGTEITVAGDSALVRLRTRGRVHLLEVERDGTSTLLTSGDLEITGHDAVGERTLVSFRGPATQGDLGLVAGGELAAITDFSSGLRETGVIGAHEITVPARDGYPVHGWVLKPAGEGPHPVLLTIHGGPFAQYESSFLDESQVYADAGYAVVLCNPRGSAGYGEEHGRAIRQQMGTLDYTDVIDFLDGAIARTPGLDPDRVGIMGGSYGGYLTAWTIAHDHRFAAAIVERGYLDPEQFIGTSDIGSFFSDEYTGLDPDRIRAQSPQAVVRQVTTPTLVIHSADDLRCPLPQGERYYAELARNGVEAELLVFPGENHELSRSGRPRHRLQRFEAILDWWAKHLPSTANPRNQTGPPE
ncbi:S9 family peptidase [Lacisediminihabitans profunda]|uniref:S9 family peptidase n=1 Tax=Lacisediminihabitans profunda TaxID=2594790 RepID=A0A5C8UT96_9MICO|nr:S9 family peptidase [Lacisediminihabitans profunda]TXN31843.1 S9 family peptidase [Lacisediminihabitans profunda]